MVGFYFAFLIIFYLWHLAAHEKRSGEMYQIHMNHHLKNFPPAHFYGRNENSVEQLYGSKTPTLFHLMDPRRSTSFSWKHEGPLYVGFAVLIASSRWLFDLNVTTLLAAMLLGGVMGSVGSALHSSFHVRGFQLERFQWYRELRALHYLHHLGDMKSNYAVLNLGLDALFRSLILEDPLRSRAAKRQRDDIPFDEEILQLVASNGNSCSLLLFNSVPKEIDEELERRRASKRGYAAVLLRLVLFAVVYYFWQSTEIHQQSTPFAAPDRLHQLLEPVRAWITQRQSLFALLCLISTILSELSCWSMLLYSLVGATSRALVAATAAFVTRLAILKINPILPSPSGFIWRSVNPSLSPYAFFSSAGAPNSFLSVRVINACVLFIMACSLSSTFSSPRLRWFVRVASFVVFAFQVSITLIAQTHFTSDVVFAILLARCASLFAKHYAVYVDANLP